MSPRQEDQDQAGFSNRIIEDITDIMGELRPMESISSTRESDLPNSRRRFWPQLLYGDLRSRQRRL